MKNKIINFGVISTLAIVFGVSGWVGYHTYQTKGIGHIGMGHHHRFDGNGTFPTDRQTNGNE